MIGTLTFAVMAATSSQRPCEGLKCISLPNTNDHHAVLVPEGVFQPATAPAEALPATPAPRTVRGRRSTRVRRTATADHRAGALPRRRGPRPSSDSLINMELWLPPADKWNGKVPGRRKRRLGRIDPGPWRSSGCHAADGHCTSRRLCHRRKRYGTSRRQRAVHSRPSRKGQRTSPTAQCTK